MTELLAPIISNTTFQAVSLATGIVCLLLTCALLFWLFRDARRRGAASVMWLGFGTVFAAISAVVGFSLSDYGFGPVGLISFFSVLSFVVVYLIVRPVEYLDDIHERELSIRLLDAEIDREVCPQCGAGVEAEFLICPTCMTELRHQCVYCGRPVRRAWRACPYCKASQGE